MAVLRLMSLRNVRTRLRCTSARPWTRTDAGPSFTPVALGSSPALPSVRRFALLPLLLLAACGSPEAPADAPAPDTAAAPATPDPALLEMADYRLTEDRVARFFAASRGVVEAMRAASPEDRAAIEGAINPDDPAPDAGDATLDEFAHRLGENAAVRAAAERAGLTPREYAVLTLTLIRAGTAHVLAETNPAADADSLARALGVDPADAAYMRTHAAELQAQQAALEAAMAE